MCSESKAQAKTNKTFLQKQLALLMVPIHGQGECNVDKTAGNIPTIFRKPFTQASEGDIKSFFQLIVKVFLWTSEMQILLLFRNLYFQKRDNFFPKLMS